MRSPLLLHGAGFAAILAFGLTTAPSSATAQSLFEALFGPSKPTYAPPGPNRLLPPSGVNAGLPYTTRPTPQLRRDDDDNAGGRAADHGRGGYQTVCVRMCDGFYWPISYSTSRSRLYRDANVCSSSCSSEARLFHYSTSGGQMQDAVDLTGRAYAKLPVAFKYRKSLVQGCTCKPEPWSQAEIDRHRIYAMNEELAKGGKPQSQANVAAVAALPPPQLSGPPQDTVVGDATEHVNVPPSETDMSADAETQDEAAPVASKPVREKTRARAKPNPVHLTTARARPQPAPMPVSQGGFWSSSAPAKYTWPGDPPARYR